MDNKLNNDVEIEPFKYRRITINQMSTSSNFHSYVHKKFTMEKLLLTLSVSTKFKTTDAMWDPSYTSSSESRQLQPAQPRPSALTVVGQPRFPPVCTT